MKSRLYWALGAVALAGTAYAVLHDPQPTTHNGLVRVPTGDADIDAKHALEDAEHAFQLHEEARMDGDFDKARYYQEAAEAAISIGNRANAEATRELLREDDTSSSDWNDEQETIEDAAEAAIAAAQAVTASIEEMPSSETTSTNASPDSQMLNNLRTAAESLEWSCESYGTNCQAAEISRKQYEDALAGR